MSLRGIIAGALGGVGSAVAKIGAEEMAQQNRMAIYDKQAELEERKLRLADELSRSRAEWEVSTDGLGGKKIEFEELRTKKVGAAQTRVEVEREKTLAPERQANEVSRVEAVKRAEARLDRQFTLERGADREYLAAKGALARANESSAARAQAAATIYAHNRRVAADRLRDQAADALKAGNKELSDNLLRQADIGEGKAQAKNFSDVAAFARTLTSLANDIADPMKNDFKSAEEEAAARAEAAVIRQQVARMGENVGLAKGVGAGGGAAKTEPPTPTPSDIEYLRANRGMSAAFDRRFGEGAAQKFLGSQAATSPSPGPAAPAARPAATVQSGGTIFSSMNDATLARIASTQGHSNQRAAQAELARRQEAARLQEAEAASNPYGQ
jgi:hypothetical protein